MAVDWVADHYQAPLIQIMEGCHKAVRNTRGAVMALAQYVKPVTKVTG